MEKKYLVIDIGGTFTKFALMDSESRILEKRKTPTVLTGLPDFLDMLTGIYEMYDGQVCGIAVSSAGVIDSDTGFMYNGGSLFFIKNINLKEILEKRCHVPVSVENDARCAALAEVWKGSLSDCRNAAAMIIGTAVGGAVIVDRRVLKGKNCMAGEFSYMLTDSDDPLNASKTLARQGGMPALIHMASARLGVPEAELTGEEIFSRADCGDGDALECIRKFAKNLAVQITNCQFVFDPEKIAIGGGVSAQPLLISLIREELKEINAVYPHTAPVPEITACRFHNDANLIGALYTHLQAGDPEISAEKMRELLRLVDGRREENYLRAFLSA